MAMHTNSFALMAAMCALSAYLSGCNYAQSKPVFLPAMKLNSGADDSMLAARVRTALMASDDIIGLDIRIQTKRDEVVLSGFADSHAQIERNITLVRQLKGVRRVVNHISIRQFT